jgi:hypothetical protein
MINLKRYTESVKNTGTEKYYWRVQMISDVEQQETDRK